MAKTKDDYPNDTHMLNFVGKYVTEINEVETKKRNVSLVQVEYYPDEKNCLLAERKSEDKIQAFRECIKEAIRVTDAKFGNRDWDVLGTPQSERKTSP